MSALNQAINRLIASLESCLPRVLECLAVLAKQQVDVRCKAAMLDGLDGVMVANGCYRDRAREAEGRYGKLLVRFRELVKDKNVSALWSHGLVKFTPGMAVPPGVVVSASVVTNPYYSEEYEAVISTQEGLLKELEACIANLKSGAGSGYSFSSEENLTDLRQYCERMQARWGNCEAWGSASRKRPRVGMVDPEAKRRNKISSQEEDEAYLAGRISSLQERVTRVDAVNGVLRDALRAKGVSEAQLAELETRCFIIKQADAQQGNP